MIAAQATPTPNDAAIPPVVWELVRFTETNGEPVAIDDPSRYTLQFLPAGQLVAHVDCTQGHGGSTVVDGVRTWTPRATTKARCPPDSYDLPFPLVRSQAPSSWHDPETGYRVLAGEAGVLALPPT